MRMQCAQTEKRGVAWRPVDSCSTKQKPQSCCLPRSDIDCRTFVCDEIPSFFFRYTPVLNTTVVLFVVLLLYYCAYTVVFNLYNSRLLRYEVLKKVQRTTVAKVI